MNPMLDLIDTVCALACLVGIPIVVFRWRPKNGAKRLGLRLLLSMILTWMALVAEFLFVTRPIDRIVAEARGVSSDNPGGGIMVILFGWVPALIGSLALLSTLLIVRWGRMRKENHRER